ncbi:MAG: hypothetical protein KC413_11850 [Anaerolineales bacterium]|nr:hypothetical protein [Anaerolineales bacterium]
MASGDSSWYRFFANKRDASVPDGGVVGACDGFAGGGVVGWVGALVGATGVGVTGVDEPDDVG